MRRLFALALVLCAGCASSSSDVADAWFGDFLSLFSDRDSTGTVSVPTSALGYSSSTLPITAKPPTAPNP